MITLTEVEVSGIKYPITTIPNEPETTLLNSNGVRFTGIVNGTEVQFRCTIGNTLIWDMHCVMGLDPIEELTNIAIHEIRREIFEIVYNTTLDEQLRKVEQCSSDLDLHRIASNDPVFSAWLYNFDRR